MPIRFSSPVRGGGELRIVSQQREAKLLAETIRFRRHWVLENIGNLHVVRRQPP